MKIQLPKIWEGKSKGTIHTIGVTRVCQYVKNVGDVEKCLKPAVVEDLKNARILCEGCAYKFSKSVSWINYRALNREGQEALGIRRRSS